MAENIIMELTAVWRSVEADGSECLCCGDKIYMAQKRLFFELSETRERLTECDAFNLCQSCADESDFA